MLFFFNILSVVPCCYVSLYWRCTLTLKKLKIPPSPSFPTPRGEDSDVNQVQMKGAQTLQWSYCWGEGSQLFLSSCCSLPPSRAVIRDRLQRQDGTIAGTGEESGNCLEHIEVYVSKEKGQSRVYVVCMWPSPADHNRHWGRTGSKEWAYNQCAAMVFIL